MTVVLRIGKQGPPGPQGPAGTPGTSGILTTKGDLLARDATTEVRLPVGANGQVLESDSVAAEGVAWKARPASTPLTTKGDVLSHDGAATTRVSVGADGQVLTADSGAGDGVAWATPTTLAHGLGSASHTTTTIAGLNALLSDGPVDVATAPRTPLSHAIGGAEHSVSSLAAFNTKISGGSLDFDTAERTAILHGLGDPSRHSSTDLAGLNALLTDGPVDAAGTARPPTAHDLDDHGAVTLAAFNALITSGDLDLVGTPRPPLAHALGAHTADSLANLNAALTDGPVDVATASRPPSGAASGDLGGTYPSPTVNDGADSTAIHVDIASEVAGLTLKATPAAGDHVMLEQLSDGAKRRSPFSAFASAGPPAVHAIGGAEHSASSLAALNALVTGGSLDFDTAARPPTAHLLGTAHTADSLANLNAKIIGGSIDFDTEPRDPNAHDLAGAEHNVATLAAFNAKISGGDLDFDTATRPPTTHPIGGTEHSASTLAAFNAKITGGDLDFDTDPRPPLAHAHSHASLTGITANDHHNRAHSIISVGDHSFPGAPATDFLNATGVFSTPTHPVHALGGAQHSADSLANVNTKLIGGDLDFDTASRPPNGPAGGDLGGTYPDPTVAHPIETVDSERFQVVGSELQLSDDMEATMDAFVGAFLETIRITVTEAGGVVSLNLDQDGGGDLTIIFTDGYFTYDTTPADTVVLTAGTGIGTTNYVYVLQSTKTLTASTAGFPSTEHAPVATVLVQSAAGVSADGVHKLHAWTDHTFESGDNGHLSHINRWIRSQHATWKSGVAQTLTITPNGGSPDNVIFTTTAGVAFQLHMHTFPAFSGTPDLFVANDSVTPYVKIADLNAALTDALGASMSGRYFPLVLWGAVNQNTGDCKLFLNLPLGSYVNANGVIQDSSKFAVFDIPVEFRGVGFLISKVNLRHQAAASGTWTSIQEVDLRGLFPSIAVGGGISGGSEFLDSFFRVQSAGDDTKELAFEVSAISTGTVRTATWPDSDVTILSLAGQLGGTAAAPDVRGIRTTSGPTLLTIGAIADGEVLTRSGSTVVGSAGGVGSEEWTYADDLTVPVTADWAISVVSPLTEDSLNSAIHALMFDDTTEEGGALIRTVPAGAARMILKTLAKPDSTPPGAETAVFHLRFREIQDNAAVGAWGAPVDLTNIDFGANDFHQKDETDNDLGTWGLVVGKTYQLLLSRDVADGDDDLDDDCGIVGVGTAWTT